MIHLHTQQHRPIQRSTTLNALCVLKLALGLALLSLLGLLSENCAVVHSFSVGRAPGGGRGASGRGRPSATQGGRIRNDGSGRGGRGSSNNKTKDRKHNARARAEQGMNRKLQADADFFWRCVSKRAQGVDIAGVCGKPWHRPSQAELFGKSKVITEAADKSSLEREQRIITAEEAKVIRSGGAMDVPSMEAFDLNDPSDNELQLPEFVLNNLLGADRMRYTTPSPIQRHCVPLALAGHDVLASAQTGSGKTVAFLLPLIASVAHSRRHNRHREDINSRPSSTGTTRNTKTPSSPAALILAPTRELALQIELEIEKLTFGAPPPSSQATATASRWSACCYGGATARPQLEALAAGVEILVATPGRLADFLDRDLVSLARCRFLVLDEADRMLDMGFEPQLNKIVEQKDLPSRNNGRQTLLFSATFPKPLRDIAQKSYLRPNFAQVAVGKVGASNKSVEQRIVRIEGDGTKADKLKALLPLLRTEGQQKISPTIIFTNKKRVASWISNQLRSMNIKCSQIHSDRTQGQRESALAQFREGKVDVLVATDAVSRGIDILDVAHVIQFDLPFSVKEFESYTHRIGRTGRAGKIGIATAFYVPGYQPRVGNAELWSLLRESFDESGNGELPDWFYQERGTQQRLQQRRSKTNPNKVNQQQQRQQYANDISIRKKAIRPPRTNKNTRSDQASNANINSAPYDDAKLKAWLDEVLGVPTTKKKHTTAGGK